MLAAANPVNHTLEVLDVVDPKTDERIRIARERERLDELGEVRDRGVDLIDLGSGSESQLRERFKLDAEHAAIDDRGVPADQADLLQTVDPPLGGGRREIDETADLAGGAASILNEEFEDLFVT